MNLEFNYLRKNTGHRNFQGSILYSCLTQSFCNNTLKTLNYENTCTIENSSNKFIIQNNNSVAEGYYLLQHRVKGEWMQSGKVIDKLTQDCLNEHEIDAKLKCKSNRENNFCRLYPLSTLELREKDK